MAEFLEPEDATVVEAAVGTEVDQAATPAERNWTLEALAASMDRERPNIFFSQRDSAALTDVEASRSSAFSQFTHLDVRTGSALLDQFQGHIFPECSPCHYHGASAVQISKDVYVIGGTSMTLPW